MCNYNSAFLLFGLFLFCVIWCALVCKQFKNAICATSETVIVKRFITSVAQTICSAILFEGLA